MIPLTLKNKPEKTDIKTSDIWSARIKFSLRSLWSCLYSHSTQKLYFCFKGKQSKCIPLTIVSAIINFILLFEFSPRLAASYYRFLNSFLSSVFLAKVISRSHCLDGFAVSFPRLIGDVLVISNLLWMFISRSVDNSRKKILTVGQMFRKWLC